MQTTAPAEWATLNGSFHPQEDAMPRLTLLAGLLLCCGLLHAAPTVSQLQDGLEHPWSLAFCRRNKVCLSPSGPAGCGCGSRAKACRRRSPACRRFTPRGRADCWRCYRPRLRRQPPGVSQLRRTGRGRQSRYGGRLRPFERRRRAAGKLQVIFRQLPKLSVGNHFGGKLAFDRQGYLFIALGETTSGRRRRRPTSCRASWCG